MVLQPKQGLTLMFTTAYQKFRLELLQTKQLQYQQILEIILAQKELDSFIQWVLTLQQLILSRQLTLLDVH